MSKSKDSILIGDQHSAAFWNHNHNAFRDFKPDFLLLEVIGKHRYMTKEHRDKAKKSYVYMPNSNNPGYNGDAFKLADDLDIPMIGIDIWDKPYVFPKGWEQLDKHTNFEYSHSIRERQMVDTLLEFEGKGKFLLIVGAEHLREGSMLYHYANAKGYSIKKFSM